MCILDLITLFVSKPPASSSSSVSTQVHYYEDGNVQLVSHKEVEESIPVTVSKTFIQKQSFNSSSNGMLFR